MQRHRIYLTVCALTMTSLGLNACGGGEDKDTAAASASCDLTKLAAMSPEDRQTTIEDGAAAEGSVVVYSSINEDVLTEWAKDFDSKYPEVEFQGLNLNPADNRDRVLTEGRAGKDTVDVMITGGENLNVVAKEDLLAENPGGIGIPEGMNKKYYGSYWAANEVLPALIVWNTDLVSEADAPKTHEDLLDPKWKGKVSIDADASGFIAGLLLKWGFDKTKQYVTDLLVGNEALVRVGHTTQTQLLAAGEFPISSELYGYAVESIIADGAPLQWADSDVIPAASTSSAIATHAPHPCAAVLAFEYLISKDGSQKVADVGRIPTNPEVEGIYPRLNALEDSPNLSLATADNMTEELTDQVREISEIIAAHTTS